MNCWGGLGVAHMCTLPGSQKGDKVAKKKKTEEMFDLTGARDHVRVIVQVWKNYSDLNK